ncbi:MAG: FtsX-like permease family protein, partial [Spirochaetales bacterium]|nr:FtsX-like permease family protein [Spirochaetales bacterium]
LTIGANENIQLQPEATNMLSVEDTDTLFGDDLVSEAIENKSPDFNTITEQLSRKTEESPPIADEGAWQFIVAKTDSPGHVRTAVMELNTSFTREGLSLVAGDWQKAAGPYGQSVDVVRIVFAAAIIILSIVAVIIITNTFVISVFERTSEIGTMRAIGASKSFIRAMFAAEAVTLAAFSSLIGAIVGVLITMALRALRIEATNQFFVILFGGQYMSPFVTLGNFAGAVLIMVLVGFIAHLYPVMLALRIQPVRAMQEE